MNRPWLRWLAVAAAGGAVGLSFQPYAVWPLVVVGVAGLTLAVRPAGAGPVRLRTAFGRGYVFGLVMLGVSVSWLHVLGVWVALALVVFESLFFGLIGLGLAVVTRLRWWPLAATLLWGLAELGYSRVPFGGFGWTRIAYTQVDSPLAGLFPLVGVAGVSLATAGTGQLAAWLALRIRAAYRTGVSAAGVLASRTVVVPVALLAAVAVGAGALRTWSGPGAEDREAVTVAIVQGNVPGRGIEAMGRARTVTDNHLSETVAMIAASRLRGDAPPDFVLWPENSTDIDPTRDAVTRSVVDAAADLAGVPILVGAVMQGPGPDERQTSALWWVPGQGPVARYDKRNLVPFGEWIPFRTQLLPLLPILEQVGAQSVPGRVPGVLRVGVDGGQRTVAVGDIICFELAYDQTVYEAVTAGAQVLTVQSNNATYGGTGQIEQQFAITRARAMEARREIAVATTNSVSGFIDRTGHVRLRTTEFTAASALVTMPLRNELTPAVLLAPWLDRLAAIAAAGWLVAAALILRRRGSTRPAAGPMGQDGQIHPSPGIGQPSASSRRQPVS